MSEATKDLGEPHSIVDASASRPGPGLRASNGGGSEMGSGSQDTHGRFGQMQMLWLDGDRAFYRASRDEPGGARRTFMVVTSASENPTTDILDRLAHAYGLRDHLDAPWAVRPLDLVHERGRTMLVLEDPGAEPLRQLLGSPMEPSKFLRLAEALVTALRGLHERGLIHKDINPSNILVDGPTNQVWLMGFGFASRLPRERQALIPPEFIPGTLAYMAPEQTGRMNRSIDSRSDLYSLGVTLYQMLTGALPFTAHDPMEWVHCHIAKTPVPPRERVESIPAPLSQIVMKLLAKTAEERYQTAASVERDLRRCLAEWETLGRIDQFPLAEHDLSDRLLIPEKLYGRSREIAALLSSFDQVVATGAPKLVLVSGYSGIGKSSVVNELHKVLVPPRGLFASGKFDQYKRDIPYATLAQAFQSLIRQILGKSEAELQGWRNALGECLTPNGQLVVDLIPELELVIGKQPPVAEISPQDAKRRIQAVLRRFIGVFARPEHPLALFLDDLHWLDAATLDLLEDILAQQDIGHLLLIGAYRDNEVDAKHPLMRKLDAIRQAGGIVNDIVLTPLSYGDLGQLIVDSLNCEPQRARPLIQMIKEKTGGNPFFSIQFLHALADEALLVLDHREARWSWDIDRIHAKRFTDNVVHLMVVKLNRLPTKTQTLLSQLASVGSGAAFALLGKVCETSQEDLHESLWEAVRAGLVLRSEKSYAFRHDRIQEAAYSLIPEDARAEVHLRIGRMLLAHTPPDRLDEAIFDIVNQLNRALSLVKAPEEREQLAELNLLSGKRAQAASAYESALKYLTTGVALLTGDGRQPRRELRFALELASAHCEFASRAIAEAEERLRGLSARAVTTEERVAVACLQVDVYQGIDRGDEAVAVGLRVLRYLGVDIPAHPTDADAREAYDDVSTRLGTRAIEDLISLPLMSDPDSLAAVDLLIRVAIPGHYSRGRHFFAVAVCAAISLGLERGHSDASCIAYAQLATLATHSGQFDTGYRFGRLGCELAERPGLQRFQARTFQTFGAIMPWTQHVREGREVLSRAFDLASRTGEISYAGYACGQLNTNHLFAGIPLVEAQGQAEDGLAFARKVGFRTLEGWILGQLGIIRSLRGLTNRLGTFDDAVFRESELEDDLAGKPALAIAECSYFIRKLQARFLAGEYEDALEAASRAQPMLWNFFSRLVIVEYHFYDALCHAAVHDSASPEDRRQHRARLTEHLERLETWALHCPENFENRAALVGAEVARLDGRDLDAQRLYQKAIRSARANGFVHNEALACEVAARFYAARDFEDLAEMCLIRARDGYLRWGAEGKVRQLETRYPQFAKAEPPSGAKAATSPDQQLDIATVVKASQALSSEMLLPRLIEQLMAIALQNAGADRGLLILPHERHYRIEAEARADGAQIVLNYGASAGPAAPESIIRYVMRTRESIILDDAASRNLFSEDPYFSLRRQRSILCLPLIRQGTLVGLLYLENALASHVFTPGRARLLELLAGQAAISLENTRLYGDLEEREGKVRRLVDSNIIGVLIIDLTGRIVEANDAFLGMVGYEREDLISGRMNWTDLTPPEWRDGDAKRVDQVKLGGSLQPFEKEYFHKDGRRVPALVGVARIDETGNQAVAFVIDLSEQKQAESALREAERRNLDAQMQLAHANRIATMGQLAASIAHEVNQPIGATLINAGTALRWLAASPPKLESVRQCLDRIVNDSKRGAVIIDRIRDLAKNTPAQKKSLAINEVVLGVIELTSNEISDRRVSVQKRLTDGLPAILGDKVQLQQVVLNLIMNAVEAMSEIREGSRELLISSGRTEAGSVLVKISDSGPGLPSGNSERIFQAFYTTKTSGLGMGLSICRSIVEAHAGRLWAMPNEPHGAVFCMALPVGEQSLE
jgi:PAS domain S-box-containing protein